MNLHFCELTLLFNHDGALSVLKLIRCVSCQNTGWFVLVGNSCTEGQQSGHSVTPTPPFSAAISGKPHAGSNEQYAGEGSFLIQHRDS